MNLTPNKLKTLLDIIDMNHIMFSLRTIGERVISTDDKNLLKKFGVDYEEVSKEIPEITKSFHWGRLSQLLKEKASQISWDDFTKYLKRGQYIPLNKSEQYALEYVENKTYSHIKGLGDRVKQTVSGIVIESSPALRLKYEDTIQTALEDAIKNRESATKVVSDIGHKMGDWNRDLGRIAETELNNAFQYGRAEQIKREQGIDSLVYKDVYLKACRHCIQAYLTAGIGSKPKIFKLGDLISNGTNIGRKVVDWLPVLESMHPHSITDKKTMILTDNGYKSICDINVGDNVLTHKGRFRKVTATLKDFPIPKTEEYKIVYTIYYKHYNTSEPDGLVKLNVTGDHKFLTNKGWVEAKNLTTKHKLVKLLKKCVECDDGYLESFNRESRACCSDKCSNKHRTSNAYSQWGNYTEKELKDLRFKISETVKLNWENGLHKNTLSNLKSDKMKEITRDRMNNGGAIKALEAQGGRITSKQQLKLYEMVLRLFPKAELEYKIFNRSLDIALVEYKIDIEFDGLFWHENREYDDEVRDNLLKSNGWHVIRYKDKIPKLGVLQNDIEAIIQNHDEKYKFEETEIVFIKRSFSDKNVKLYDLTVEEDESFIARGVVLHNCRCQLHSVPKGYEWNQEKQTWMYPKNKIVKDKYDVAGTIKVTIGDKIIWV